MPFAIVDDDVFGKLKLAFPRGYRHVPVAEFAERRRKCLARECEEANPGSAWDDLRNIKLYDTETKEFLQISGMPYRWRLFVEKLPSKRGTS